MKANLRRLVSNEGGRSVGRGSSRIRIAFYIAGALVLTIPQAFLRAQSVAHTSLNIMVKDAETDQPINQARLTLQFREPASMKKLKVSKMYSYSAKTNSQGRCKFSNIPKGTIRLVVTAEQHQTFGKEMELERDNQLIEVKLKKPQPLL